MLTGLLERASLAIGRLDARISATPVRSAWLERASWTGFAEARRAQGAEMDEIDVFALACGAFLPNRRRPPMAAEEQRALTAWQHELSTREDSHWRELVPAPLDLPIDWHDRPALLRALQLVGLFARESHADAPWRCAPRLLAALGVTREPLPCLVIADPALRFAPRDRDAIVPRYLKRITAAAETGLERLNAIEADRRRAALWIEQSTRPGKLPSLLVLLQRRPLISPLAAAQALRTTRSGAGKLLTRAAHAGLVVEISGRTAWKLYLTPDLAAAFGYRSRPAGRPVALPASAALDPVLARFDAEIAQIDQQIARLDAMKSGRRAELLEHGGMTPHRVSPELPD